MKYFLLFLSLTSLAFAALPTDRIAMRRLAFSIMFDQPVNPKRVDSLVNLCRKKADGFRCPMPSRGQSIGALGVEIYPLPLERLQETISIEHKEAIFKSTISGYKRDLDPGAMAAFLRAKDSSLSFITHQKVIGKFRTRFAYDMQTGLWKSGQWLMERESTRPGARETRGAGGYINDISYFTILYALDKERTLRILGSWDDAGGNLPVFGKIRAKYQDIYKAFDGGRKDIRIYFKIRR